MHNCVSRRNLGWFFLFSCVLLTSAPQVSAAEKDVISLTVDYGDGVQKKFKELAWKEGMTVADAIEAAQKHPRGIKIVKRGSGETTLLTQIDDLKNGQMERYWIYEVNGREGDQSYALTRLKSGDSVLWRFDIYK